MAAHPEPDFRSDPELFCHPDPEFSKQDPVPSLFRSLQCQLLPTHVCQGAYIHCKYTPSISAAHPELDFRIDPEFFCHPDPEFSKPDPIPYLFRSLLCQLLPTHVCHGAYTRRLPSGLHIRNRIFAQIRNFFAIRTRNFPNLI